MGEIRLGESLQARVDLPWFFLPRRKGERGDKESDERSKGTICFCRYFLFQRDHARMQMSKVSTRETRKERWGKRMADVEYDRTLRIYYALIALCNVLLRPGNVRICI